MEWISLDNYFPPLSFDNEKRIPVSGQVLVTWYFVDSEGFLRCEVRRAFIVGDTWMDDNANEVKLDDEDAPRYWMPLPELPKDV